LVECERGEIGNREEGGESVRITTSESEADRDTTVRVVQCSPRDRVLPEVPCHHSPLSLEC